MKRRRRILFIAVFLIFFTFAPLTLFYYALLQESQVSFVPVHQTEFDEQQFFRDLRKYNETGECDKFPPDLSQKFPKCLRKMQWLRNGWKTHDCYAEHQVDGSICSFRRYLSLVERFCPVIKSMNDSKLSFDHGFYAQINTNLDDLFNKMSDVPDNYLYMKTRISRLWPVWTKGIGNALEEYPKVFESRRKLNIIVLIGFLANEASIKFAKKSGQGGPLGELLQWSDLIASLSILGHNLQIATDKNTLKRIVTDYASKPPCAYENGTNTKVDIIFTDIMGLRIFRKHRLFLAENKCRVRLLDSFGTHAEFATKTYFMAHKDELSGNDSKKNPWGGHALDLRQHWTFFPHSHDNTFLGFVVDISQSSPQSAEKLGTKFRRSQKNSSLVYGKEQYMWQGLDRPIQLLKELTEVHATVADSSSSNSSIFSSVINHGFLTAEQISSLLDSVKIFFGMGFPLEGPAPLEAIAHGAVFINAKFRETKSRRNDKFLSEKPTLREWTSQCPYMEDIGPPYVYTVDIQDENALRQTIKTALENPPPRKVPIEFTTRGMLVRVSQLLQKQDFCDMPTTAERWPPIEALKIVESNGSLYESCEMACTRHGLVCEPTFFRHINNAATIVKHFPSCMDRVRQIFSPIAPYYDGADCSQQKTPQLYSCASRPSKSSPFFAPQAPPIRLCPCRDFLNEQHALCSLCL